MASTLQLTDSNPLLLQSPSTADQTTAIDSSLFQERLLPLLRKLDASSFRTPPPPPPSSLSPSHRSSYKNHRRGPESRRRRLNGRGCTSPSTPASSSSTSPSSPTTPATVYIKVTGEKSADMVTDGGAIYVTENQEYNWKAPVQETVSATLN